MQVGTIFLPCRPWARNKTTTAGSTTSCAAVTRTDPVGSVQSSCALVTGPRLSYSEFFFSGFERIGRNIISEDKPADLGIKVLERRFINVK